MTDQELIKLLFEKIFEEQHPTTPQESIMNFVKINTVCKAADYVCKHFGCEASFYSDCVSCSASSMPAAIKDNFSGSTNMWKIGVSDGYVTARFVTVDVTKGTCVKKFVENSLDIPENSVFDYSVKRTNNCTDVGAKELADAVIASMENVIALQDVTHKLQAKLLEQVNVAFDTITFRK